MDTMKKEEMRTPSLLGTHVALMAAAPRLFTPEFIVQSVKKMSDHIKSAGDKAEDIHMIEHQDNILALVFSDTEWHDKIVGSGKLAAEFEAGGVFTATDVIRLTYNEALTGGFSPRLAELLMKGSAK